MPRISKESSSSGGLLGTWNASTNTPTLADADTGKVGVMYKVSDAGSTDFGAGSISYEVGDIVVNDGTVWGKIDATDAVLSVASKTGVVSLVKADVGLPNVDNTADTAKPVSTAQQTALNLKANLASPTFTGTVAGVTKTHVGLANVDNTSDANKPVSTATTTQLDLKSSKLTVVTKSSAYSLTNTDIDTQVQVTGTTAITLPDSLTWSTDTGCEIINVGAGVVTIPLGGSVTINGVADVISLDPYEGVVLTRLSANLYFKVGK